MKIVSRVLFLTLATTISFLVVSALLPYSAGFLEANKNSDPVDLVYILLSIMCICAVMVYVIKNSTWKRTKLLLSLMFVFFFVYSFITQIETLFFHSAIKILSTKDIFLIMIGNGTVAFVGVPLAIRLFGGVKETSTENINVGLPVPVSVLVFQLFLIGAGYVLIYFVFGYFVAWQEEELRVFYSGNASDKGLFGELVANFRTNPIIFPFQFLRGILFGLSVLPINYMFNDKPKHKLISLVLILSSTGIMLIIPNVIFPDAVRLAHLREMISSMFVFAFIVWLAFEKIRWTALTN